MIKLTRQKGSILYVALVLLFFANTAQAYVDPGTGSFLFQLVIAGILGGLFYIKTIFRAVKKYLLKISPFGSRSGKINQEESNE